MQGQQDCLARAALCNAQRSSVAASLMMRCMRLPAEPEAGVWDQAKLNWTITAACEGIVEHRKDSGGAQTPREPVFVSNH